MAVLSGGNENRDLPFCQVNQYASVGVTVRRALARAKNQGKEIRDSRVPQQSIQGRSRISRGGAIPERPAGGARVTSRSTDQVPGTANAAYRKGQAGFMARFGLG